jgi:predicted esterase
MKTQDPTFCLPRILCLHGGGTNARIFRMQCRVLESTLRSTFRLVYAEAPFLSQPGSDVTSVYRKHGPFKSWLRIKSSDTAHEPQHIIEQINTAIATAMTTDSNCGATGEWVALLGFSQGAKLAASILFAQQTMQLHAGPNVIISPNFRFAVLMAGRGPLVWLLPEQGAVSSTSHLPMHAGLVDAASPSIGGEDPYFPLDSDEHILRIPTIHVHGLQDPGLKLHRDLMSNYCEKGLTSMLEWDGGHRIPIKRKDVDAVVEEIYTLAQLTGVLNCW